MKVCALIVLFGTAAYAQNLVPNPSFEQYFQCPSSYNQQGSSRNFAPGWASPTQGTPDLFNRCSFGNSGVPKNWAGVAQAHKGYGYCGIYVWLANSSYREYLQTRLTDTLVAGRKYGVEFFFRLAGYSKYSINQIGALLSDSTPLVAHDRIWQVAPSFVHVMDSAFSQSTGQWNRVYFEYVAKGGERFLSIGNFAHENEIKTFHLTYAQTVEPLLKSASYFYVDDVTVTPLAAAQTREENRDLAAHEEIKTNEVYILNHIYFSFNSYDLMPLSFEELNLLVSVMKKNPTWRVELSGHTDDKGDNLYNYNLSLNRAKTVGRYLVQYGVDAKRIKVLGFGKRMPLKPAKTEEARALNRRVEVKFLAK